MGSSQCWELYFHFFIPECVHHQLWTGFCRALFYSAGALKAFYTTSQIAPFTHTHTHSYKHIFLCLSGIEAKIHTQTNSDESTDSNSRFLHKNSLACRVEHPWIEPTTFRLVDNLLCGELIFHHGIIPTYEMTASQTLTTYWCMDVNGWSFAQHNE